MKTSLAEFNGIWQQLSALYRRRALEYGISEGVMWVLYSLTLEGGKMMQRDLCLLTGLPKQTVHSALKKLEGEGYIVQESGEDHRTKWVLLTVSGHELAERTAGDLIHREEQALGSLPEQERRALFTTLQRFADELAR